MTNYNQRNKFGGGNKSRSRGGDRGDSRQSTEMFNTICADCGKSCQVPFKPNGMKPVYCRDCFAQNGGQVTPRESSPRSFAPAPRPFIETKKNDEQTKLLEALNTKLDKLISLAEQMISSEEPVKPKKVAKKLD